MPFPAVAWTYGGDDRFAWRVSGLPELRHCPWPAPFGWIGLGDETCAAIEAVAQEHPEATVDQIAHAYERSLASMGHPTKPIRLNPSRTDSRPAETGSDKPDHHYRLSAKMTSALGRLYVMAGSTTTRGEACSRGCSRNGCSLR